MTGSTELADRLPFDRYQRYAFAARVVESLRSGERSLRLLEVGANVHCDLEKFLPRDRVVFLDLSRPTDGTMSKAFVQGDATAPPFRPGAFDIVIALDVLEHIRPAQRHDFLAGALRMASQGVIVGAPFQAPEVETEEQRLNAYFRALHGSDYPWLVEHRQRGLPDLAATLRSLQVDGWVGKSYGHGNLALWAKLMQVHFYVNSEPALLGLRSEIDQLYNRALCAKDWAAPTYRHFLIAVPTVQTLDRLQGLCETTQEVSAENLLRLQEQVDRLYESGDRQRYEQFRAEVARQQEARRQETEARQKETAEAAEALERKDVHIRNLETLIQGHSEASRLKDTHIYNLETACHSHREALAQKDTHIHNLETAYHNNTTRIAELMRALQLESHLRTYMLHSWSWRVTAPLRAFLLMLGNLRKFLPRRLLPTRFERIHDLLAPLLRKLRTVWWSLRRLFIRRLHRMQLEPLHDLVVEGETFRSRGEDPQFLLHSSRGWLPTTWVVISYETESEGQWLTPKLYINSGLGFSEKEVLTLPCEARGRATCMVRLPNRVCALRLDPLAAAGRFALRNVTMREITALRVAVTVLWRRLRPVLFHPHGLLRLTRRAVAIIKMGGAQALKQRLLAQAQEASDYQQWIATYDTLTDVDRELIRRHIDRLTCTPLISVVLPVYNPPEQWLRRAIESVRNQLYPHWELCIADDASSAPHVRRVLEEYQAQEPRLKAVYRQRNGHISAASNSAIDLATGEWLAFLDHDDELAEHALYLAVVELNAHPDASLIYSDEDKIDEHGRRHDPYFKPDWNPDLFLAQNLVTHLCVCRTRLVRTIGGFCVGYEGAQDWDLVMRMIEQIPPEQIRHVPHVLYHWRTIPGSTALAIAEKGYARKAQWNTLASHFARIGQQTEIIPVADVCWRIKYPLPQPLPLVTLIIPTRNGFELLRRCIKSISHRATYPHFELIIVDNQSDDPRTLKYLQELTNRKGVQVLRYDAPFNYSAINNFAARHARGEVLGLINNDVEVISPDWLEEMVSQALRPEVGAVGAMLYYPDDTIQHAGVILGLGGIGTHAYAHRPSGYPGQIWRALLTQNLSAVTGACLVLRRQLFAEVGGLDETHLAIAYNDIDLCLRIREKGYRNLWTPHAHLYHHESASRGLPTQQADQARFQKESEYMKQRWGELLLHDPAYNPNLALDRESFMLAFPPRAKKRWLEEDSAKAS